MARKYTEPWPAQASRSWRNTNISRALKAEINFVSRAWDHSKQRNWRYLRMWKLPCRSSRRKRGTNSRRITTTSQPVTRMTNPQTCFVCGGDHFKRNCPQLEDKHGNGKPEGANHAKTKRGKSKTNSNGELAFVARVYDSAFDANADVKYDIKPSCPMETVAHGKFIRSEQAREKARSKLMFRLDAADAELQQQ